jgi:sulfoxide reductase heme-binding subunit YedZ
LTVARRAWLVPAVLTGTLVPFGVLAYRAATSRLGPNPVATALNQLGLLALTLLVASLLATPAKLVTGATWPLKLRKLLGLAAFFAALLHLAVYVVLDQGLDFGGLARDVVLRPFIAAGFAAVVAMTPLALTSTRRALQRLGPRRWQALHRLAYVAGVLGVVHYVLRVKAFPTEPALYGAVLGASFAVRAVLGRHARSS